MRWGDGAAIGWRRSFQRWSNGTGICRPQIVIILETGLETHQFNETSRFGAVVFQTGKLKTGIIRPDQAHVERGSGWHARRRVLTQIFATFVTVTVLFVSSAAIACSFHNYKPTKTFVDWVLNSQTIVLARPDSGNPFRYVITKYYRGTARGKDIPFLVDSTSRRRLLNNPEHGVLFAIDSKGNWTSLSYIDEDRHVLLNAIMRSTKRWGREAYHPDRFLLFADYQDHPNPHIRKLALQEIDRVPYPLLRTMQVRLTEKQLLKSLGSLSEYPYRPINFLLLGLTGSDTAKSALNKQAELMPGFQNAESLGAVATALIELEGVKGIEKLTRLYLLDPAQALGKLESIVESMAIHNSIGPESVRTAIRTALLEFVARRPNGAAMIARQFSSRQDWSIGPDLEAIMEAPGTLSPSNRLFVAVYVAQYKATQN
ncbi:MAG: hypothetical protein ABJQ71_22520 [Roseibium sp.]